ncbi:MAG: hypothetical protein FJ035_09595 [Chloroflexi bacterium]|nr:hypothetical protein [Chloroflexota bacterium]
MQPDRLHIKILGLEIISIGADSWFKAGDTWTKQSDAGFGGFQSPDVQGTIRSFTGPGVTASGSNTVSGKRRDVFKIAV